MLSATLIEARPINFIVETCVYLKLGGIDHIRITMFLCLLFLPIDIVRIIYNARSWRSPISFPLTGQFCVFSLLLFLWGLGGYYLFLITVTNRYYIPGDPLVDWHPLLPKGCEIFDPGFGGKLINGATCDTLRLAWAAIAVPV